MIFFSLGLIRGLIAEIAGTAAGMGFVMLMRFLMGLPPWKKEPVVVVGIIVGGICFLFGVGAFHVWLKWARGQDEPIHHGPPEGKPAWTRYFGVDYSHRIIAVQYVAWAIVMLCGSGLLASIFRSQLVQPGLQLISTSTYNTFVGVHGWGMIAAILMGSSAMANFLVPLLIGSQDMALPRLNALGFWINIPAGILLFASYPAGGWDTGWTAYAPLAVQAPLGQQFYLIAVFFFGMSSILSAVNLLTTIATQRAPGMTLFRMPIFIWAVLATNILALVATQLIALSFVMIVVERLLGMGFFNAAQGGNPVLYQHMFWFYSHPAVYIFVLPGLGIISELLPVFCRKPLFGYKWVALSSIGIALSSFLVWAHHMFAAGMEPYLRIPFMITTLFVAVPTGVKVFSWMGTIWRGKLTFPTPMLFAIGAISVFLIGGLSGPPNGLVPTDLFLTDTYWIVGHFHAVMFGGFVFPFFAALYYWFPKITGRMYEERLGKLHFWIMLPAFWVQTLVQSWTGLHGMRRRIATYDVGLGVTTGQIAITLAGIAIAISVLIMLYNLITSTRGPLAENNPWRSRSPEWHLPTPIGPISYQQPPVVVGEPYDYGLPGSAFVRINPAPAGVGSGHPPPLPSGEQGPEGG